MFEKRVSKIPLAHMPNELRNSQTTTFVQNHSDIKISWAKKDLLRLQTGETDSNSQQKPSKMYSTEFDKDYVIKIIDEVKNEVELKLAHSNFEYMPRDVLQMIGNQNTQSMAKNEQKPTNSSDLANKKLVSLDIQYNKM